MSLVRPFVPLLVAGALAGAGGAAAQEPVSRADSLARRVRLLELQLDSLRRRLDAAVDTGTAQAAAGDELAALRAAARDVAPERPADTVPEPFVIRSRSLSQLNPEISVTADVRVGADPAEPLTDNVQVREFAFSFQSALDPYSNAKVFASFGHEVEIEEAYAYWTGLPGGVRADIGRFRQQAGELNRWHLHGVPGSEYPLVIREYFGHHGLVGDGLGLYWMAPAMTPGGGVHELFGQVTLANNAALFDGGRHLAVLGHLNNFWQLTRSTFAQVGFTGVRGENPDSGLVTTVAGVSARVTWRPPDRALYRTFTLRGEGFWVRRSVAGQAHDRAGAYVAAESQRSRRIVVGTRVDWVEPRALAGAHRWAFVPYLTYWQSEWVFLRAEWQHQSDPVLLGERDVSNRLVLQIVWSMGPHKHESY